MRETASAGSIALDDVIGLVSAKTIAVPDAALLVNSGSALIMKFDTMTPVNGSLAESANPESPNAESANIVRGVAGGGLPWSIASGSGSLSSDGHLVVRIRGLVLATHPEVPASLQGTNPFPAFRIVVSCLRGGGNGALAVANVSTGDFVASSGGDSEIDARVSLPHPCIAPIVLVTGPSGTDGWLAVTGR
jgi:hypothetical protein